MPRTECKHCGQIRVVQGRGLCTTCWRDNSIKERYPKTPTGRPLSSFPQSVTSKRKPCDKCKAIKVIAYRGLCYKCYRDKEEREKYGGGRYASCTHDDMTEEELDAVIAEQLNCLPKWWDSECP